MPSAPSLLLIHDQDSIFAEIREELLGNGYGISEARCVISGLEIAAKDRFEAIIIKEVCGTIDALDLLRFRLRHAWLCRIPVILLGVSSRNSFFAFQLGCDDHLLVPANPAEIVLRISRLLQRINRTGLNGDFSVVGIFELIQMLCATQQTGSLELYVADATGLLFFERGQVVSAVMAEQKGEQAMASILRKFHGIGSFSFAQSESSEGIETNIEKRTDHLLLELANAFDEETSTPA